jgi:hypothetical protein
LRVGRVVVQTVHKMLLSGPVALLGAASVALAATGGHAKQHPTLAQAVDRTAQVTSLRYVVHVRITKEGKPLALRVRGQTDRHTISIALKLGDTTLPDGTKVPGPNGAVLIDGPFLYERAPSSVAVLGKVRWLRIELARLSPSSNELKTIHALTPTPLLRVLRRAHTAPAGPGALAVHGSVAYDDPIVRPSLAALEGGIEFRSLRVYARIGSDGLVHRMLLTGRTADGTSTLSVSARLFGFGRPVHVSPPAPGTFMDQNLLQLEE